jgi:hypothetical protein
MVSVALVATACAGEDGLRLSVGIVDRSTARATFARVFWIDKQHRDAGSLRLVGDELAKLGERPIAQACSLSAAGRNPAANMGQFFQPDRASGAFCGINERLRNAVVFVALEPRLLLGQLAQTALGRLRAARLKTFAAIGKLDANGFDALAGIAMSVAVRRDVGNAEIDTKRFERIDQFRIVDVADASDKPLTLDQHQIDLAATMFHQQALMFPHHGLDLDATVECPDRNDVIRLEADNPIIVWLSGVLAKLDQLRLVTVGFVRRVRVGDFGDAANGHLRRDLELSPRIGIGQLMQVELSNNARFKAALRQEVAGLVATLERASEQAGLLFRRLELDVGHEFHSSSIERSAFPVNPRTSGGACFPLPALAGQRKARVNR